MPTEQAAILLQLIADKAAALASGTQGVYYPSNHHRVSPLVPKAPRLISGGERKDLYFHLLRLNSCPTIRQEAEFALLLQAYDRMLPLLAQGYPQCRMPRSKGLFLFGVDHHGPLAVLPAITHEAYLDYAEFWRYAESFAHMPGMLKKQPTFAAMAADEALVQRAGAVLARMDIAEDLQAPVSMWFWTLMLLVLQHPVQGAGAVEWLLRADGPPADRAFLVDGAVRFIRASHRNDLLEAFALESKAMHGA